MRNIVLTAATAVAILAACTSANAMTAGTAPALRAAGAQAGMVQDVIYVCRHRALTSSRRCWWRPSFRGWRRWW